MYTHSVNFTLPGMRGSTPLDVAAASCIDNNELALALQEQDLEMVWEDKKNKNTYKKEKHIKMYSRLIL